MGNIDLVNNRPDYSFRIFSSQSDYTLIRREIWLLDDETSILGVLDDDTHTILNAIQLDYQQTLLLKQVIDAL